MAVYSSVPTAPDSTPISGTTGQVSLTQARRPSEDSLETLNSLTSTAAVSAVPSGRTRSSPSSPTRPYGIAHLPPAQVGTRRRLSTPSGPRIASQRRFSLFPAQELARLGSSTRPVQTSAL